MADDRAAGGGTAVGEAGQPVVRVPKRHRVMQQARILIGRDTFVDCVVRDLSRDGAKICLARAVVLPASFELIVAAHDLRTFTAHLRWQRGDFAGVAFVGAPPAQG